MNVLDFVERQLFKLEDNEDYREVEHVSTELAEYDELNETYRVVYEPWSKMRIVETVYMDMDSFSEYNRFVVVTYDVLKKRRRKSELEYYYLVLAKE